MFCRLQGLAGLAALLITFRLLHPPPCNSQPMEGKTGTADDKGGDRHAVLPKKNAGTNRLCFYLVSESNGAGMTYYDSPDFPRVGYIHAKPDLVLQHLESVKALPMKRPAGTSAGMIEITLTAQGKQAVAELTRTNVHKQILIIINDILLGAPYVLSPITSGEIGMTFPTNARQRMAERMLRQMVEQH
ncbi:MAG TPA: hypothetical protein VHH88_03420 [Verrucomicrobiae bacterium]|nr:hypothetical protein [Verrucomicrobiae bacterium]